MLRLGSLLLDAIVTPGSFDYIEDLTTAAESYCLMLGKCSYQSSPVLDFIRKIFSHLYEKEPLIRRIMIKVWWKYFLSYFLFFSCCKIYPDCFWKFLYPTRSSRVTLKGHCFWRGTTMIPNVRNWRISFGLSSVCILLLRLVFLLNKIRHEKY